MTAPYRIEGLDHIVLRARDLGRLTRFYCDVLGCSIERDRPDLGLIHLRAGRSQIDLIDVAGPLGREGGAAPGAEGRSLDHVCLRVTPFDLEAIRVHLGAFGVTIIKPSSRFGADGMGPSFYIDDPEGNRVELKGPPQSE